jgi:hypothetical protein
MPGGGGCFGCNLYDPERLTPAGNLIVSAGGVIFTQLTAAAILWTGRRKPPGAGVRGIIGMLFYIFLLDLPFQVLQGLPASPAQARLTWVDMRDFLYLLRSLTGISLPLLKGLLAAVAAAWTAGASLLYFARPATPRPALEKAD